MRLGRLASMHRFKSNALGGCRWPKPADCRRMDGVETEVASSKNAPGSSVREKPVKAPVTEGTNGWKKRRKMQRSRFPYANVEA